MRISALEIGRWFWSVVWSGLHNLLFGNLAQRKDLPKRFGRRRTAGLYRYDN